MSPSPQRHSGRRYHFHVVDIAWILFSLALMYCAYAFLNPFDRKWTEETSANVKQTSSGTTYSTLESMPRRLHREASTSARFQDLQHTPTGSVMLGHSLFRRVEAVDTAYMFITDEFRRGVKEFDNPYQRDRYRHWDLLCQWNRKAAARPRTFGVNEYVVAFQRFRDLSDKSVRTADETQQMWNLIVSCGRDWLKIPFNEQTQEFDLNAELPDDAPERALMKLDKMKQFVEHFRRPTQNPAPEMPRSTGLPGYAN